MQDPALVDGVGWENTAGATGAALNACSRPGLLPSLPGGEPGHAPPPAHRLQLYFAGKPLDRSRPLSAALGHNEKTRAVVWVHPAGRCRPPREPVLTEEEQAQLMAWQFRRQEAERAALTADAPEHGSQGWADPTQLRASLQGLAPSLKLR